MKAVCWHGKKDIKVDDVPQPKIQDPRDAIVKVSLTAICGSDLHIYNGIAKFMKEGDVLGHEFMGEVVELGSEVTNLRIGDRVVVPFPISCGECFFCKKGLFSLCDVSNPNKKIASKLMGFSPAGIYGYTHMLGGFPGGQAEYVRVPFADVGPIKIPEQLTDEEVLFLSDVFPTGYMAAENCGIEPGDVVAVWGCGPVGQFAIKSAKILGADRVIAIDLLQNRLDLAAQESGAEIINIKKEKVRDKLLELTNGRGPDRCIDCVGTESHSTGAFDAVLDRIKQATYLGTDRAHVLREAIINCRKGGTVSVPGVYFGFLDKIPFGAAMNKGLTFKMGQTHVQRYLDPLLKMVENGVVNPSFIITHRIGIDEAPDAYKMFAEKLDNCIKVVIKL